MSGLMMTAKLVDVAELNPPLAASLDDAEEVSFMPMSAVDAESVTAVDRESRPYSEVSKGYTPFLNGDVLVAKITPCFENGKIVHAHLTRRYGFGSTEFHVVRPRGDLADARYVVHFLRQDRIRQQGESRMTGSAGQRRVPENFLAGLTIPLPALAVQRRIAEVLDKADALRAKRRAALAQLDALTQSIFLDMFGDPESNPKGWPVALLRDCTEKIQIGPFGSLLHQEDYVAGGIPLVNPKHIRDGVIEASPGESVTQRKYSQLGAYHLKAGDVVMGRRGEMGRCAIVEESAGPLLCGTGSLFIRPDGSRTSSLFLHGTLSSGSIKTRLERLALGQTLPNLNSTIVEQLEIPIAPFNLQADFARRLDAVKVLRVTQEVSSFNLNTLFSSLQHRAFRGAL